MKQSSEPGINRPWYQLYQTSFAPPWSQLPATGFVRLWQIIGDPTADPPIPAIIPVKKSCWWEGVRSGRFPKSVKLGPRVTAWRVEDIRVLIANLSLQVAPVAETMAATGGTEAIAKTLPSKARSQPLHLPKPQTPPLSTETGFPLSPAITSSNKGGVRDE